MLQDVVSPARAMRLAQRCIEPLEARVLLSTSVDANGFTVVSLDAGARAVYVSSSTGSDQNSGATAAKAVASLGRAGALVRDGSADQVLLKSGDTWTSGFPQWTKSGRDEQHPIFIGSFGAGARPLILTGDVGSAFLTAGSAPVSNLVISGLQFRSDVRDPASANFSTGAGKAQYSGFRWYAPTAGFTLQDCSFQYYSDNLDIEGAQGPLSGVSMFGCQSLDSYNTSGGKYRSQGFYGYAINGLSISQSLFDHNGWSDTLAGADRNGYDHNIYLSSTVLNASIQDNVIANASNNGLLARGGGDIENNLFLDNPSAISYGDSPVSMSTPGGVTGAIVGNVILGDAGIGSANFGYGITLANTAPGTPTLVADNIFTGDIQRSKPAIELTTATDTRNPAAAVGINDLVLQNNLFNNWYRPLEIESSLQPGGTGIQGLNGVSIRDNNFQSSSDYLVRYDAAFSAAQINWADNNYTNATGGKWFEVNNTTMDLSEWKDKVEPTATSTVDNYPDANVSEARYDAALGGAGTSASFLNDERAQSAANWNPALLASAVNDYVRRGLGAPTAPVAAATAAAVTSATAPVARTVAPTDAPSAQYTFTVTYADTQSLNSAGIASGNVDVVGPNDFSEPATLVGVSAAASGKSAAAMYSITPPGGAWSGMADGSYTLLMQADQVRNAAGIAVPQGAIGNFDVSLPLVISGAAGNDKLTVREVKGRLIVTLNRVATSYSATDVPQLQIYTGDGNDRVTVGPGVLPVLIDGGVGNDIIRTFNGHDTLIGNDGNDTLAATAANNLLLGGAGNDTLVGALGPNLMDGGAGDDRLRGGRGDDVLIGDTGSDRLQAGRGNQLLIGAASSTTDLASLAALLNNWANGQPYTARLDALAPANAATPGSSIMLAGITFIADPAPDTLIGGARQDWFIESPAAVSRRQVAGEVVTSVSGTP